MRITHLRQADLNLLVVFAALAEELNVSRTAERLLLSQPAVSRALQRLRDMFRDDLLIRATSGYELTPQGQRLLGELEVMLPKLDRLLSGSSFDPGIEQAVFRIAATDNAAAVLAPLVCRNILPRAKKVRIDFLPWHTGVYDQLVHGRIDLAMAANIVDVQPPLQSQTIYNEDFLCAVDRRSPYKRALTIGQYIGAEHLSVSIQSGIQVVPDKPLAAKGYKRKIAMQLPYHEAAIRCVAGTPYIATIPLRFVEGAMPNAAIRFLKPPPEVSGFRYVMTWHPRVNTDAAHAWLRETMRQLGASLSVNSNAPRESVTGKRSGASGDDSLEVNFNER